MGEAGHFDSQPQAPQNPRLLLRHWPLAMVPQPRHSKDHGPRSYARIMGHDLPDYGLLAPSHGRQKNDHRDRQSKGCCPRNEPSGEAGHVDSQAHALGAYVHKKTPQNPRLLLRHGPLAMVLQPRHSKGHGPRSYARIMGHDPPDYGLLAPSYGHQKNDHRGR